MQKKWCPALSFSIFLSVSRRLLREGRPAPRSSPAARFWQFARSVILFTLRHRIECWAGRISCVWSDEGAGELHFEDAHVFGDNCDGVLWLLLTRALWAKTHGIYGKNVWTSCTFSGGSPKFKILQWSLKISTPRIDQPSYFYSFWATFWASAPKI